MGKSLESFASSSAWIAISRVTLGNWRRNFTQGVAPLQIIDQILERNARSTETGRSIHQILVGHDYGL